MIEQMLSSNIWRRYLLTTLFFLSSHVKIWVWSYLSGVWFWKCMSKVQLSAIIRELLTTIQEIWKHFIIELNACFLKKLITLTKSLHSTQCCCYYFFLPFVLDRKEGNWTFCITLCWQKPESWRLACQTIVGDKENSGKVSEHLILFCIN